VSDDVSNNAAVSGGGVAGVASAKEVNVPSQTFISNFFGAAPPAPEKPTGPIPPCPYPGLAYFSPEDASRFFGREVAIQALVAAVTKRSFTN